MEEKNMTDTEALKMIDYIEKIFSCELKNKDAHTNLWELKFLNDKFYADIDDDGFGITYENRTVWVYYQNPSLSMKEVEEFLFYVGKEICEYEGFRIATDWMSNCNLTYLKTMKVRK